MIKILLFLALITLLSATIILPLIPLKTRCMVVYTVGESQTVKFDITLPVLPDQLPNEHYTMEVIDTEQNVATFSENIQNGVVKREVDLDKNVVYDVCFTLNTQRYLKDVHVQYLAENLYTTDHSNIKLPDSLLKVADLEEGYKSAIKLEGIFTSFKKLQEERNSDSEAIYESTKAVGDNLITVSAVEFFLILGAGIYQFFALRNYLFSPQNY